MQHYKKDEMEDTAVMAMNVPEVIFLSLCKRFSAFELHTVK